MPDDPSRPGVEAAPRPEPRGSTMADLLALTAGVALAASLDWYSTWTQLRTINGATAPGWYIAESFLRESLQKGCAALLPVIVARRVRYGGPIRPAEFLALTLGFPRLLLSLERLPGLGLVYEQPGRPGFYTVNPDTYDLWEQIQAAVGVLAAVLFVLRRRRPPPWVAGLLLVVAWHGAFDGGSHFLQKGINERLIAMTDVVQTRRLIGILASFPNAAISFLPFAAAAFDLRRSGRRAWTWVEWAAMGQAVGFMALARAHYLIRSYLEGPRATFLEVRGPGITQTIAAIGLALAIVRRFGPAWRRWMGRPAKTEVEPAHL